jgi:hypothetical protein
MKRLALLASIVLVGAAEARITVYRNQDVLVDTLQSAKLQQTLEGTTFNDGRERIRLGRGELVEASVEVAALRSGTAKRYSLRLDYEVRGRTSRTFLCTVPVSRSYEVLKSPQNITYSRLGDPAVGDVRCR